MENKAKKMSTDSPRFSKKDTKQNAEVDPPPQKPVEIGGPKGLEPTRYGDWEKAGRCSDF